MGESANPLPEDLESCHALIGRLRAELEEARRALAESQRRELEDRFGKGTTAQSLLAYGQAMSRAMSGISPGVIEAELAAEDAMRVRRTKSPKPSKKK
jgi:hypothetical protein